VQGKDKKKQKKKNDILCSYLVRQRAIKLVGGCQRCLTLKFDKTKEDGSILPAYKQLHWAHYRRRALISVRWNEDNSAGLCPGCHLYLDDESHGKEAFFKQYLGETKFQMVNIAAQGVTKTDYFLTELYIRQKISELRLDTEEAFKK